MTWIRTDSHEGKGHRKKRILILTCDTCGIEFEKQYQKHVAERRHHFCCLKCKHASLKSGGSLHEKTKVTVQEKYGTSHVLKSGAVIEKSKTTKQRKHGSNTYNNRQKARATSIERYGVDNPAKAKEVRDKTIQTCVERYGVETPLLDDVCRQKGVETAVKNWGHVHYMKSQSGIAQWRSKLEKKLGVDNPMKLQRVRDKFHQTMVERHGVDEPFKLISNRRSVSSHESRCKAHVTRKQNGSYGGMSLPEDDFHHSLCAIFGAENIERHATVNGWSIDFLIVPLNFYIEYDGVYWHGLDRPLEVIREFKNPRDKTIYATYMRDREKDAWFDENEIIFTRVLEGNEEPALDALRELYDEIIGGCSGDEEDKNEER